MSVLPSPERVLPTLNADGTRRRVRPKLSQGRYYSRRRVVAWALIAAFALLPFLKLNHKPLILLDVVRREFTLFGRTFLATDGVLLMLLLLCVFAGIVTVTALAGRVWCGWACPQTVYMEFLFRPLERLFEGNRAAQLRLDKRGGGARRVLKNVVFLVLGALLGNLFLSYFVGVETLVHWMTSSPSEHPAPFVVMAVTSALVFFDFAYFREQMCTVVCPYARFQSVLLDTQSLVVGYDRRRGEPRTKGKPRPDRGDCIDCNACVVTCPTGIDIRDGLQLECIACAQCADACDRVMDRIGKPRGLVRYGSPRGLEGGQKSRLLRTRTAIYLAGLAGLAGALVVAGQGAPFDVTLLRGLGAPYVLQQGGDIQNQIRIKVRNRASETRSFDITLDAAPGVRMIAPENPLDVPAGGQRTTTVFVVAPPLGFTKGEQPIGFSVSSDGSSQTVEYRLLGPEDTLVP